MNICPNQIHFTNFWARRTPCFPDYFRVSSSTTEDCREFKKQLKLIKNPKPTVLQINYWICKVQEDGTKVCSNICLMLHLNFRVSSMSHSEVRLTEIFVQLRLITRSVLWVSHVPLPELKLSCKHLLSVAEFITKFNGRQHLFTKSQSWCLPTHTVPAFCLIQPYPHTYVLMSTKMCVLRWSGEHCLQREAKLASSYPVSVLFLDQKWQVESTYLSYPFGVIRCYREVFCLIIFLTSVSLNPWSGCCPFSFFHLFGEHRLCARTYFLGGQSEKQWYAAAFGVGMPFCFSSTDNSSALSSEYKPGGFDRSNTFLSFTAGNSDLYCLFF